MFVRVYLKGDITWDELAEIPLMTLIVGGGAWHAYRSAMAQRRVQELAALETSRLDRQRAFLRDTAHAIRTPVTIARGNIELIQLDSTDPQLQQDSEEVLHQLDRLHHMARRLLVIEALHTSDLYDAQQVDVGAMVADAAPRWSGTAPQRPGWPSRPDQRRRDGRPAAARGVDRRDGGERHPVHPARRQRSGSLARQRLRRSPSRSPTTGPASRSRTASACSSGSFTAIRPARSPAPGSGCALVAAVSSTFNGDVWVGDAPEGGALVRLRLPRV